MPMRSEALRAWPWVLALAGCVFDLVAFWPGQMSFDSAYAWWQARGGETSTLVPPAFVLAWRACLSLLDGPGALFALQLALFWSGLALLARALCRGAVATAALFALAGFAPVVLVLRGHVWTDVALFSALTFATGALATADAGGRRRWLAPGLLALAWAGLLRHNALPAIVPLLAWGASLALREPGAAWRRAGLALALLALVVAGGRVLDAGAQRRIPLWPSLAQFDLAAISVASGTLYLPPFMHGPALDPADLAHAFRPWSNTPMLHGTRAGMRDPFEPGFDAAQREALRDAWVDAIRREPRAWLAHRWALTRALFGTHQPDWPRTLVYVDAEIAYGDNPPVRGNDGALHRALFERAPRLVATPWLAAWPCLGLGLVAAPFAWRRRATLDGRIGVALLASAWLYALPLTVFAPAAELRYLGWPCVASLLAFAACLLVRSSARTARLEPAFPEGAP